MKEWIKRRSARLQHLGGIDSWPRAAGKCEVFLNRKNLIYMYYNLPDGRVATQILTRSDVFGNRTLARAHPQAIRDLRKVVAKNAWERLLARVRGYQERGMA